MLLALAGVGSGLFLFVVFPWLATSRAAEARTRPLHVALPSEATVAAENDGTSAVELAPELVADEITDEDSAAEDQTVAGAVGMPAVAVPGEAGLVASQVTDTGPKLKHIKGGGKADTTTKADQHATQRDKRQEQRAEGIDPKAAQAAAQAARGAKAVEPNPNREKVLKGAGEQRRELGRELPKERRRKRQEPTGG